jgi:hypothetical protein
VQLLQQERDDPVLIPFHFADYSGSHLPRSLGCQSLIAFGNCPIRWSALSLG